MPNVNGTVRQGSGNDKSTPSVVNDILKNLWADESFTFFSLMQTSKDQGVLFFSVQKFVEIFSFRSAVSGGKMISL